jgi:hypothetical protein
MCSLVLMNFLKFGLAGVTGVINWRSKNNVFNELNFS